jgi:hypothetical protein
MANSLAIIVARRQVTATRRQAIVARSQVIVAGKQVIVARRQAITARRQVTVARRQVIALRRQALIAQREVTAARRQAIVARSQVTVARKPVTVVREALTATLGKSAEEASRCAATSGWGPETRAGARKTLTMARDSGGNRATGFAAGGARFVLGWLTPACAGGYRSFAALRLTVARPAQVRTGTSTLSG